MFVEDPFPLSSQRSLPTHSQEREERTPRFDCEVHVCMQFMDMYQPAKGGAAINSETLVLGIYPEKESNDRRQVFSHQDADLSFAYRHGKIRKHFNVLP